MVPLVFYGDWGIEDKKRSIKLIPLQGINIYPKGKVIAWFLSNNYLQKRRVSLVVSSFTNKGVHGSVNPCDALIFLNKGIKIKGTPLPPNFPVYKNPRVNEKSE